MPYRIRKQDCVDSKGNTGTYVLQKKKNGKWVKASCHSSREKAEGARRARGIQKEEKVFSMSLNELRELIREVFFENSLEKS
jgi:hypothetical protein